MWCAFPSGYVSHHQIFKTLLVTTALQLLTLAQGSKGIRQWSINKSNNDTRNWTLNEPTNQRNYLDKMYGESLS